MKPFWQSKTLWINLIMAIAAFFGQDTWVAGHPEVVAVSFTIINMLLRFVTKDQITIA